MPALQCIMWMKLVQEPCWGFGTGSTEPSGHTIREIYTAFIMSFFLFDYLMVSTQFYSNDWRCDNDHEKLGIIRGGTDRTINSLNNGIKYSLTRKDIQDCQLKKKAKHALFLKNLKPDKTEF